MSETIQVENITNLLTHYELLIVQSPFILLTPSYLLLSIPHRSHSFPEIWNWGRVRLVVKTSQPLPRIYIYRGAER